MKQCYQVPRITTRGYYDLYTGKQIKHRKYYLFPKKKFQKIESGEEIVIFVHGMRNTRWGAKKGANTLRIKLRQLGYLKHPVIAFSYDADVRGAHLEKNYYKVLKTATKIAIINGCFHLAHYIKDLRHKNQHIKIHLVGHSLGCIVVQGALTTAELWPVFHNDLIESVHLFGSPLECGMVKNMNRNRCVKKLINYYNPTDEVIKEGVTRGDLKRPSCLFKPNIKHNKRCYAKDHRFKSYVEKLRSFP